MAKRPTLTDITAAFASASMTNANFDAIEQAFDNTLSRDGSTPNSMLADLDMNGFDILNVGNIESTADSVSRSVVEEYLANTRAEVAGKAIDDTVEVIRTGGYDTVGDGGHALYMRTDPNAEPSHAFKVQSADGTWWEGVSTPYGMVWAEQFGAVGKGSTDNQSELTDALDYVATKNFTLIAKGKYLINSTLVFPNGTYGFIGPDVRDFTDDPDVGFIWGGGNNDVIVEMQRAEDSYFGPIMINNRANQATGITGLLVHNPDAGAEGLSNCQFEFISIYGCNVGLQIGDFTNDGWDSNWEQNVIQNLHFYEVANPLIIDSNDQDNITINYFHNGGPSSLGAYVGTRSHIIHVKRNGNGLKIDSAFSRLDDITTDNAAILIEDGSFSTDYFSFEGAETALILHLDNPIARDQSTIREMVCTNIEDSSGRSMLINNRSGTMLEGCSVSGDIEVQSTTYANGTVFESGGAFVGSNLSVLSEGVTLERTNTNSAVSVINDVKTPSSLSSNTDNYNPGFARLIKLSSSAAINITGIDDETARSGEIITLININASDAITLTDEDTSSTSNHRFSTNTGSDIVLAAGEMASMYYDTDSSRWRVWKL